jgi:hypothetical protein
MPEERNHIKVTKSVTSLQVFLVIDHYCQSTYSYGREMTHHAKEEQITLILPEEES